MTTTRYFVARFAQAFGILRRPQRMGDAASEMHLLREAETQLGMAVWERVDTIERLSIEYWNLRKLVTEQQDAITRISQCEKRLELAHEERSSLLNSTQPMQPELYEARLAVLAKLEELSHKRDVIVAKARNIRRIYDGLKIKLNFLTKESDSSSEHAEALENVKDRLTELKLQFVDLKAERSQVGAEIEEGDIKLDKIEVELEALKLERHASASTAFQVIGETNKELSSLRAELGVLDTRMRQLYGEIGRYVSRQALINANCAKAVKTHHGLVEVMRALRRSIALNHRLAGMS